jgi:hypothetical protein
MGGRVLRRDMDTEIDDSIIVLVAAAYLLK